ncbi:MAG TPA: tetratricopeptide repeat protein [Candidatus Baltobacteraceae bacterium]|nr:tetratricopeptide repeat protein [Candidatus Baltobacteraceae bacterium]
MSFNLRRFLALFRPELYTPFELALRDMAHHRYEQALKRLDALLADPQLPPSERAAVTNKRGVALIEMGRMEEARAAFEQALRIVPKFAPALVNIGNLHLEAGEMEEAIRLYESAVLSDEAYALAHHNLGVAYKRLGRTGDAVRELRRAHRLEGQVIRRQRK